MKTTDIASLHILLWSFRQGCFHYETLDKTIESGINAYGRNHAQQDYIVLAVRDDTEKLSKLRNRLVEKYGHYAPTKKS